MERKDRTDIERYRKVRNIPTPVAKGLYEMAMKAFENGLPNYEQPVILRGYLLHPYQSKVWRIKTRGAEIDVRWFMDELPPDVVEGERYTIVGDLLTANLGSKVRIYDCVLLKNHTKLMESYELLLKNNVIPVGDYIERPQEDTYFVKE
jgi:hypothetical protein